MGRTYTKYTGAGNVEVVLPKEFNVAEKIKVDVLQCGHFFHVLKMAQKGVILFVVKDCSDFSEVFEDEVEALAFYHTKEEEVVDNIRKAR
jgi:hypothetical protein